MFRRINFLNLPLDLFDFDQIDEIEPGSQIISLNAEQVVLAEDDLEFHKIISESELVIADGSSIVLGVKMLAKQGKYSSNIAKQIKKIAGVELAEKLIERSKKLAILGSNQKVIDILQEKYKNKLVFAQNGYFSEENKEEIQKKIIESKPDLLLVGMGAPKQEKFIFEIKKSLKSTVLIGVGGSLEIYAQEKKRAPKFFITLHLEWLYRLIREPFRFKRIFTRVPRYLGLLLKS